jgi:hypothetical protein
MTLTSKKTFYLENISSDIIEESYERGELESTGCGLKEKIGEAFATFSEMLQHLNKFYGLSDNREDYDIDESNGRLQTEKQVANHSEEQNGGWMEPTPQEIEAWKEGRGKLYREHYEISFHKIAK